MVREYDVFEKFPDGSSLWRACVLGLQGTRLHLRELTEKSGKNFYAIDMVSGKIVRSGLQYSGPDIPIPQKAGKRSKIAAA